MKPRKRRPNRLLPLALLVAQQDPVILGTVLGLLLAAVLAFLTQ